MTPALQIKKKKNESLEVEPYKKTLYSSIFSLLQLFQYVYRSLQVCFQPHHDPCQGSQGFYSFLHRDSRHEVSKQKKRRVFYHFY
jgi:hypothetical protein